MKACIRFRCLGCEKEVTVVKEVTLYRCNCGVLNNIKASLDMEKLRGKHMEA